MTPPRPGRNDAANEATAAAAAVTADAGAHPDTATWDDAVNDRIDHHVRATTARGVLLASAAYDTSNAREYADRARQHRETADELEAQAAAIMHRLSDYREALHTLDARHRTQDHS